MTTAIRKPKRNGSAGRTVGDVDHWLDLGGGSDEEPVGPKLTDTVRRKIKTDLIEPLDVPVDEIDRSPWQPRVDFPAEEIQALAETIASHGQDSPVLLRPKAGGRYELVNGERRWLAVQTLGYATIRAEVRRMTDAEVREAVLITSHHAKPLSAIEQARGFQAILDAGDAKGPTELARRLGVSQGHVSNTLRLLELPQAWQQRVISGEIPPAAARSLVPYLKYPAIVKTVEKRLGKRWEGTVDEFERVVEQAISANTKALTGSDYDYKTGQRIPYFEPTPEQRARLNLIEVEGWNGEKELRAANVALWNKLQGQHKAAWKKEHPAKVRGQSGTKAKKAKGAKAEKKPPDPAKMTPAQRARWEEAERKRDEQEAEDRRRRREEIEGDWNAWLIAEHVREEAPSDVVLKLLLYVATSNLWCDAGEVLTELVPAKSGQKRPSFRWDTWPIVRALDDTEHVAAKTIAACFWRPGKAKGDPGRPSFELEAEVAAAIVADLQIDREAAWLEGQMGPLSEAWWNAHSRDELVALNSELGAGLSAELLQGAKDAIVQAFLAKVPKPEDKEVGLSMPKELTKKRAGTKSKRR